MGKTLAVGGASEASKSASSPAVMAFRNAGGHFKTISEVSHSFFLPLFGPSVLRRTKRADKIPTKEPARASSRGEFWLNEGGVYHRWRRVM